MSLSPTSIAAGSGDFTITIAGTGFPATPLVYRYHPEVWWSVGGQNGVALSVNDAESDATHVTATVPASLVEDAGDFSVQVQIWFKADDTPKAVSNTLKFKVTN